MYSDPRDLDGTQPGQETFANNCLVAHRLAERGVRYIQLFHWGLGFARCLGQR